MRQLIRDNSSAYAEMSGHRCRSAAPPSLAPSDRIGLGDYFQDSWELYEALFRLLREPETFQLKPDPFRHPLVFYLGHTAAFYVNKLRKAGLLTQAVNSEFESLFAVGVDPKTAGELAEIEWPNVEEVWLFRSQVYDVVRHVIDRLDESQFADSFFDWSALGGLHGGYSFGAKTTGFNDPAWAVHMAIEHERLHWETTSVLFRQCPSDVFGNERPWPYAPVSEYAYEQSLVELPPGNVVIGKSKRISSFGWDNEYGRLKLHVPGFRISRNLTTNREYLDFVWCGGYDQRRFWCLPGWNWKCEHDSHHPKFWVPCPGGFCYRATFDELDMPLDWPVEVNHYQAAAYCRWKGRGYRLPTESEHRRLFSTKEFADDVNIYRGSYNNHLRFGSPTPVGMCGGGAVNDLCGNVWQLLRDDFYPLPGFKSHPLYPDFSTPYFGSEHGMLLGGSWATTGTAASPYYRLWFRRFFFQHAGFRMAYPLKEV